VFETANSNFRRWLTKANARNMANSLSAQLAATTLNAAFKGLEDDLGLVVPACLATAEGANIVSTLGLPIIAGPLGEPSCSGTACATGNGYLAIGTLLSWARSSLAANGNTTNPGPLRTYQECLKDLLVQVNTNGGEGNCPLVRVIAPAADACPFISPY
jgi:hypothetical protein